MDECPDEFLIIFVIVKNPVGPAGHAEGCLDEKMQACFCFCREGTAGLFRYGVQIACCVGVKAYGAGAFITMAFEDPKIVFYCR